jgi:hypothetical protein
MRVRQVNAVAHAVNHSIRRRLIEAMWHSAEPLSPLRFHGEYVGAEEVTLRQVIYHVRQLENDQIIRLEAGDAVQGYERP